VPGREDPVADGDPADGQGREEMGEELRHGGSLGARREPRPADSARRGRSGRSRADRTAIGSPNLDASQPVGFKQQ
jgi:hypothetical protein